MPESKKIPIQCKICEFNFQNEHCEINDSEDEFIENFKCEGFSFCPFHLIAYLEEMIK